MFAVMYLADLWNVSDISCTKVLIRYVICFPPAVLSNEVSNGLSAIARVIQEYNVAKCILSYTYVQVYNLPI